MEARAIMVIRAVPADTSPEAFRVLLAAYRAMPGSRRLELALQLSDEIREVAVAGIRSRCPEFGEADALRALATRCVGSPIVPSGSRKEPAPVTQHVFFE